LGGKFYRSGAVSCLDAQFSAFAGKEFAKEFG
jgi:hypothetical protein